MATDMTEALAALEHAVTRIERLESQLVRQGAAAARLRSEVETTLRDLDRLIDGGRND